MAAVRQAGVNASCRSESDRKPWPPLSAVWKNASSSSRVTLPLPSRSSRENTIAPGDGAECELAGEVEIGRGQRLVVVAVEASEIGVAARELGPRDPAVAVAVIALAGRFPVKPGLRHGRAEPAVVRAHRLVLQNAVSMSTHSG